MPALAEIYRWTDSAGRVHFGERPPGESATRIDLPESREETEAALPDAALRRERQQRLLESFEYERARKAEREAETARRASQRATQCERLRQYWQRLNHPGPIYEADARGERRYWDESERQAEQRRIAPIYRQQCGAPPS